jgi:hypothetical protein
MQISKEEKKALQTQYKLTKPPMGVFAVINKSANKYYLESTHNLKTSMNSIRFMLNFGSHPHRGLQTDWKTAAADGFALQVLEQLEYDKDESKTDYSDELELLKSLWIEKLSKDGIGLY